MAKAPKYKFLPEATTDVSQTCPILIIEGKFEGIVYRYGKISFNELDTGDLNVMMDIEMITAQILISKIKILQMLLVKYLLIL
jgi:hypothetical protein